ncbi:hypothetical protein CC78DRAFT_575492 [Lojkania enalia]|uniref:Uncharacterized protein n=1 Tax=Lojkania enalia TaxID=147567 RepID=A0A9P4N7D9_9PLEO|nr:hypothetical protein CC78DRAFT_575492 [Didymosphaeria enalia]
MYINPFCRVTDLLTGLSFISKAGPVKHSCSTQRYFFWTTFCRGSRLFIEGIFRTWGRYTLNLRLNATRLTVCKDSLAAQPSLDWYDAAERWRTAGAAKNTILRRYSAGHGIALSSIIASILYNPRLLTHIYHPSIICGPPLPGTIDLESEAFAFEPRGPSRPTAENRRKQKFNTISTPLHDTRRAPHNTVQTRVHRPTHAAGVTTQRALTYHDPPVNYPVP